MRGFDDSAFPPGNRKTHDRVNRYHERFIRELQCTVCGAHPVEAAHVRIEADGGMGLKPSSQYLVPLCAEHHRVQHTKWNSSERRFWEALKFNPVEFAYQLYANTGNHAEGERLVKMARAQIAARRFGR